MDKGSRRKVSEIFTANEYLNVPRSIIWGISVIVTQAKKAGRKKRIERGGTIILLGMELIYGRKHPLINYKLELF